MNRRVAVVGAGVAGLTAAHVCSRTDDVTIFDSDDRLGGHAHTHELVDSAGVGQSVDSGFIVHNVQTYPTLLRLFGDLGVQTQDAEMSMSIWCRGCGLQYAGARGLRGLFAQPSAVVRGPYLRMLSEVTRFHRRARALLADGPDSSDAGLTLGEFLRRHRFSRYFVGHFAVPLVSAVWSCGTGSAMEYPARYLFAFLANHGMLSVTGSPQWRTVVGGSRRYVEKVAKELVASHTTTPVRAVRRVTDGIEIVDDAGVTSTFDACVIATHADSALSMLPEASAEQRTALGAFAYSRNETLLHTDPTILPSRAAARASWNYLLEDCVASTDSVVVSYDMNRLQRLSSADHYVVTLGARDRIDPGAVLATMHYEHPIFTAESVAAQAMLPALNTDVLAFAGAYHGWGFHEDGALSGLRAAESIGGRW